LNDTAGPWTRDDRLSDGEVLDRLSDWPSQPSDVGWGSACDFIEFAAELIARTGRPTDPVPVDG
jgi:hypothetical protein